MIGADAGSTQLVLVLWEQTRPNTKHATGEHTATSTSECERSPKAAAAGPGRQHQQPRLCRAALARGSFTASSRAARAPRPSLPPSLPPSLSPEASRRLHLDVAARRRAGFPFLSIRHAAVLYRLHWLRCAAAQQTPEVRRCCDRVLPSSTVGQMKTNFKLCRGS